MIHLRDPFIFYRNATNDPPSSPSMTVTPVITVATRVDDGAWKPAEAPAAAAAVPVPLWDAEVELVVAVPRLQVPLVSGADDRLNAELPVRAAVPVAVDVTPGTLLLAAIAAMALLVTLSFACATASWLPSRLYTTYADRRKGSPRMTPSVPAGMIRIGHSVPTGSFIISS
jgi:hypothetical protein